MPIVNGGHPYTGVDAPSDDVGGPVPTGNDALYQQHVTAQLLPAMVEHVRPEDHLDVPGLFFDGYEHRAVPTLGVLAGDSPASHQDFFPFGSALHGSGG